MRVNIRYVTKEQLGSCPAEIDMESGVISINKDVWEKYDSFEKKFIIQHELGHFNLQTDDEQAADRYAIERVYKTDEQSLKRSLQTLYKVGIIDTQRMWQLYIEALKLDSRDGNEDAAIELYNINNNILNLDNMGAKTTYIQKKKNRFEGEDTTTETVKNDKKGHKWNGFAIGGAYFSLTNVLLIVNCILVAMIAFKNR